MTPNFDPTKLPRQALDLLRKLTRAQQISLALVALLLIGGLAALLTVSTRTDYGLLYGRLDDVEAGRVVSALNDAKVPYRTGQNGAAIYVPAEKVYLMRMQLAAKGIPKGDGVGFEIFDRTNFGISDFVQRANYVRAIQGELARTISQLDEVDSARVMVVLPENRLLIGENKQPTASVFVRVKGNGSLPVSAVQSIRFLVANAVEGLLPNRVSVVDNRGTVLAENNTDESSLTGLTANQLAARQKLEQYLGQKAQSMLEQVLGPGQAVVRVAVELNTETVNRTEEKYDPKGQVPRSTMLTDETTETTTANNTQAPGMATNAGVETNTPPATATPTTTSRTNHKVENNQYELSRVTSNVVQNPGDLKRVSAAVFVAARTTGTGTDRKVAPRSPEEIQKLSRIVQSALGLQLTKNSTRQDEITLEEMPFNDWFATETTEPAPTPAQPLAWWVIPTVTGAVVLMLATIAVSWWLLRRRTAEPAEQPEPAVEIPALNITLPAVVPEPEPSLPLTVAATTDGNGHDDSKEITLERLNQLLRENPSQITQAVNRWLLASE
jgi:flagellar M-ring protein FliF